MLDLLYHAEKLEKGQSIKLNRDTIVMCAEQNLSSKLFDYVRESDIKNVIRIVNNDWEGFTLVEDAMDGRFTLNCLDT